MNKTVLGVLFLYFVFSGFVYSIDLTSYPFINENCITKQNSTDLFCSDENYEKAAKKIQLVLGNRIRSQGSNDFDKKLNILETKVRSSYEKKIITKTRKAYLEIILLYVDQYQNTTVDVGPLMNELFGNKNQTNSFTSENKLMPVMLKLLVEGIYPRRGINGKAGFGVRFNSIDINENSVNPVIQGTVPEGYCFEFNSIPLDFVFLRNGGGNRNTYNDRILNNEANSIHGNHQVYCGIDEFKIVLPKKQNFFTTGFGAGFVKINGESTYPICTRLTFSADNAQYDEKAFCVQSEVGNPGEGFVRIKYEDGIKNGQIKTLKQ